MLLILATEWNEFKQIDFSRIQDLMKQPIIMDGRNLWDENTLKNMGFQYFGVGRGTRTFTISGLVNHKRA